MPRTSKKPSVKSPFQIPEFTELNHQWEYLQNINAIASEVSEAIKKLTPQCLTLFGGLSALKSESRDLELRYLIGRVFDMCVWKESREGDKSRWFSILSKNNVVLSQILEVEKNLEEKMENSFSFLNEEEVNNLREVSGSYFSKPRETINAKDLQYIFRTQYLRCLRENDEVYRKFRKLKQSKLKPLIKFQEDFDLLLKEFYLEKQWIAMPVFEAIWDGTGKLKMDPRCLVSVPEKVVIEIKDKLEKKQTDNSENNSDPEKNALYANIRIPSIKPFTYEEEYTIASNLEEYENNAVEAYRQHLHHYLIVIKDAYEKSGYKHQRRPYEYKRVEWLVWWNIKQLTAKDIAQKVCETTSKNVTEQAIKKALEKFINYDLPFRA